MIITITGASGVGKTFTTTELTKTIFKDKNIKVFHFDDMELPNWEELEDVKKWQEEATVEWIDKLVEIAQAENTHIIFEGSTEIKFYLQGFEKHGYTDYKVLLFDCSEATMKARLMQRGQPELYNANMIGWLNYLRKEAIERNVEIIETDQLSMEAIGQRIMTLFSYFEF